MSFEFKTPHLHHGKTMDPLEFHAKYNRLERKHRRVEKELAELKAEMEKNRVTSKNMEFLLKNPLSILVKW